MELGTINNQVTNEPRNVEVVVGQGMAVNPTTKNLEASSVLAVADMTSPAFPSTMAVIWLDAYPIDVILKDNLALVATANHVIIVDLSDPAHPRVTGKIPHVGSRLEESFP